MPANITLPIRMPILTGRMHFTLTLVNKDAANAAPAKNVAVTVHQLGADDKPAAVLVDGRTDTEGRLQFFVSDKPPKDPSAQPEPLPKIQFTVSDVDGNALGQPVVLQPERDKELPVQKVSLKAHLEKLDAPLGVWKAATSVNLSPKVEQALKTSKVGSLATLRAAKDIEKTPDLASSDIKELELLRKHARLQLISRDHKTNQQLVEAGFSDVTDIAQMSRSSFTNKLKGKVDPKTATALHGAAMKATAVASRLALNDRVDAKNNRGSKGKAPEGESQPCNCDCQSAVSPLAYLASLLDYTVRHVRLDDKEVSLESLGSHFFQPFAKLPADLSASEVQVRQIRLCIEVLRKKAFEDGVDVSAIIEAHVKSSYRTLLSALGVTHTDLRRALTESPKRQQTLADRLGVPHDKLFYFLLKSGEETEMELQMVFGLPTTQPVLGLPTTQPGASVVAESTLQKAKLARLESAWHAEDDLAKPIWLDPDFMSAVFFAVTGSSEERLLEKRRKNLAQLFRDIHSAVSTRTDKLTEVMKSDPTTAVNGMHGLGIGTAAELDEFNQQRQDGLAYTRKINGQPVALDFDKLGVRKAELDQLLIVRQLAGHGHATGANWAEACHILTAIEKRKHRVPSWQAEERAEKIVLSPAVFALPGDLTAVLNPLQSQPPAFLRWRLDTAALGDWLKALENRIALRDTALASIQAATDAAEEAHFVALRDALLSAVVSNKRAPFGAGVKATDSSADRLEKKRKWVTNYLLISAHESACRKTTRTAQAIESLQVLIWGIHNRLVEHAGFSLDSDDFESEWKVLGTYKAWRAQMWVYLYPENIARPAFSRYVLLNWTLETYKLLMNYWQLLAVEPTAGRPERDIRPIHWNIAKRRAQSLLDMNFQDRDFMAQPWLDAVWKLFLEGEDDANLVGHGDLEAAYFVPMYIAFRLRDEGRPAESIEWLRRAADLSTGRPRDPAVADYLDTLRSPGGGAPLDNDWLTTSSPHEAAVRTPGGYERRVVLGAISAYLDMAEADFTRDTPESLAQAREAYLAAINLLGLDVLGAPSAPCTALTIEIGDDKIRDTVIGVRDAVFNDHLKVNFDPDQLKESDKEVAQLVKALQPDSDMADFRHQVRLAYEKAVPKVQAKTMKAKLDEGTKYQAQMVNLQLEDPVLFEYVQTGFVRIGGETVFRRLIEATPFSFCIPPNPIIYLLRLRAESGFYKLTHCMNIAGMKRETPTHSAPTDVTSGLDLDLAESTPNFGTEYFMPPGAIIYRYRALIERAKQLVSIAQQVESTYLQFLEKMDIENYSAMKAKQDLGLAGAAVSLQDLRVDEAVHGKDLAQKQYDRSSESFSHFEKLLEDGLLDSEEWALNLQRAVMFTQFGIAAVRGAAFIAAGLGVDASALGLTLGGATGAAAIAAGAMDSQIHQGIVGGLSSWASIVATEASYERRAQEWEFQKALAEIDKKIAEVQQTLADDRYKITLQERRISELSRDHATDVVAFLDNKFTNHELYAWMSGVVRQAYCYFLQQASSMAKLAQRQLAFERQEPELGWILDDYWTYTRAGSSSGSGGERDRKGMTGSVRLLQDITRLDQHAFLTDRRRIPLPKHISLSAHDPVAFMRFRETGVLPIATSLDLFDRDFPGDYLRLVKRIRVSVIALIPPLDGIKATLASSGISRVVRGGDRFVETPIATQPETVAITAPVSGPGVMELQQEQADMLLPFEGLGVAGNWVLKMPKAANAFDFNTIADVVFTIEYSAIYSDEYRQQVVQRLNADRSFEGERAFSLRQQFADEWYNLHHPELFDDVNQQLQPVLEFKRSDYPPNLIEGSLKLSNLTLYVARKDGITDEVEVSNLSWESQGGRVTEPRSVRGRTFR